jgi:hypothetical protein
MATLDHAMGCDACRRELELLRSVTVAGGAAGSVGFFGLWRTLDPRRRAAAAAVLFLTTGALVTAALRRGGEDTWRGGATDIVVVSPSGPTSLNDAATLVWRSVPGATLYQAELISGSGENIYSSQTSDTLLLLPPTVTLTPGTEYVWTVTAERADGTQARGRATRFLVTPR